MAGVPSGFAARTVLRPFGQVLSYSGHDVEIPSWQPGAPARQ
jgi:hypothetical protein